METAASGKRGEWGKCGGIGDQGLGLGIDIGIVYVDAGEISKEDLAKEFAVIYSYKTNWPWPVTD